MTDYLERLLLEWQEEDEDEPFTWKRLGYRGRNGVVDGQQAAADKTAGMEPDGGRMERVRTEERRGARVRSSAPQARLAALERAVARGKAQQAAREWSVQRAGTAQTEPGGAIVGRNGTVPGVQRNFAGALDAAFERDARRYDGPLGLF